MTYATSSVAQAAVDGCSHVIHLAAIVGGIANFHKLPFTLTEVNNALTGAIVHAAVDHDVQRFTYVSSSMVFERATQYPTTEAYLPDCPVPESAYGFSKLAGEVYTRAAHDQHGLRYTICRPFNAYGPGELPDRDEPGIAHAVPDLIAKVLAGQRPLEIFGSGEQTRTLTHVDDIADGVVTATGSPAGENEDFNISASEELSVAAIARLIWEACGEDPERFELRHLPTFAVDVQRRWPSVEKARAVLGWEAQVDLRRGLDDTVALAARPAACRRSSFVSPSTARPPSASAAPPPTTSAAARATRSRRSTCSPTISASGPEAGSSIWRPAPGS